MVLTARVRQSGDADHLPKKCLSSAFISDGLCSISQCPVSVNVIDVTLLATIFAWFSSAPPMALSPSMVKTGIGSFVTAKIVDCPPRNNRTIHANERPSVAVVGTLSGDRRDLE